MFADGGLSALGINVFNMAIVTSLVGWLVITSWKKLFGEANISIISGSIVAGLLSVIFSSIAFVFEYALGGTVAVPLSSVLLAMLSTHLLIGLGEGVITALIVSLLLRVRSDLVYVKTNEHVSNNTSSVYGLFIFLLLCFTLITPYASSSPDGLESVAENFGFLETDGLVLFLNDYGISGLNNSFLSTIISAVLGIVVVVGISNVFLKFQKRT